MEIGKQIKLHRGKMNLSQEDFALKVYVSRQTISNWENDKSYPDVKSLLLMSHLFEISLDQLVKGDVQIMKEVISKEKVNNLKRDGRILNVLFIGVIVSSAPLVIFLKWTGLAILSIFSLGMLYYAYRVEQFKKANDIQTYREIISFMDGETLDHIEKHEEIAKRPYQKILLAIGGGFIAGLVSLGMIALIELLL